MATDNQGNNSKKRRKNEVDNSLVVLTEIVNNTNYTYEDILNHSVIWINTVYRNITKVKQEEFKLQAILHGADPEKLNDIGIDKKPVDIREQPNFDVRKLESIKIGYSRRGKK